MVYVDNYNLWMLKLNKVSPIVFNLILVMITKIKICKTTENVPNTSPHSKLGQIFLDSLKTV